MKIGTLSRITYPTGGHSEFVFEANDYGGVGQEDMMPIAEGTEQQVSLFGSDGEGILTRAFTISGTAPALVTITVDKYPSGCESQILPPCPLAEIVGEGAFSAGTVERHLSPGSYMLRVKADGSGGYASIQVRWRDRSISGKKIAGGLRVAEVQTGDALGNIRVQRYQYTRRNDPTRSSGMVNAEPAYGYTFESAACGYTSRSSVSKMPLGEGPAVGYREVTVLHGANGEFGKTHHIFRSIRDTSDAVIYALWPHSTRTSNEWKRGQQVSTTEYNASDEVQQHLSTHYQFRDSPEDTITTRRFRGLSTTSINTSSIGTTLGFYQPFEVVSAWLHPETDSTIIYNEAGTSSVSSKKSYTYGNPAHLQATKIVEANSDGTQRITRLKYPADYGSGSGDVVATALTAMRGSAHIHSPVIERWVSEVVGSTERVVEAELNTFKAYGSDRYLPYERFVLSSASPPTNFTPSSVSGSFTRDSRYILQESASAYDIYGRPTHLVDARGKSTKYLYGGNPNNAFLTRITREKDGTGSIDLVTELSYNSKGYLEAIRDEGGSFRRFVYDSFGRLSEVKNHGGVLVEKYSYQYSRTSGNGWSFQPTSPNLVTTTTYLTTSESVTRREYLDGLGRPVQQNVRDGSTYYVSAEEYDAMGRPWRSWKPYPRSSSTYDPNFAANATSHYNTYLGTSSAKPYRETEYTRDALSRLKRETSEYVGSSATGSVSYTYGVESGAKESYTEITDEVGKKRRSYTDLFGNEVKVVLGQGASEATTTTLGYNVLGGRTRATDPRGLHTTYTLDTRGLLQERTSPDAGTRSHKYDRAGNLRYTQDAVQKAAGSVHFTSYDFAGRPLRSGVGAATFSSLDPDATTPPALETTEANWREVWRYDGKPTNVYPWSLFWTQINAATLTNVTGRLSAVASRSNGAWQLTLYSYDADGEVSRRYIYTQNGAGTAVLTNLNTTESYTRNLQGALTGRTLTVGGSTFRHWYSYDGRGLLSKVYASTSSTKPSTADLTYTYRPGGSLMSRQYAGGPQVTFRYDIRERLERIGDPASTIYPFSARYAYHANGTISEAEFYSKGTPAAAKRYRYAFGASSYDALNRLKSADYSAWSGSSWTSTLAYGLAGTTYDKSGNITALKRYRESGSLVDNLTYTIPSGSNRMSKVSDAISGNPETWDARTGNFTYDANGNLKTAPAPYSVTAATYDQRNLPLSLTSKGATTSYRYDHAGQRIAKQTGSGNTEVYLRDGATTLAVYTVNGSGAVVSSYSNLLAGDLVVGRHPASGARKYYHTDLLGSTRAVVEGATVVESYDYDPWGVLMPGRTKGSGTKEGFTGKERDSESGLDYFGARLYMSALGRWTTVDPPADSFPSWSPYNYVFNNPAQLTDPDGRCPEDQFDIAGDCAVLLGFPPWIGGPGRSTGFLLGRVGYSAHGAVRAWRAARAVRATAATGSDIFAAASSGGKHAGFLGTYARHSAGELEKAVTSMRANIAKHSAKLRDPRKFVERWDQLSSAHQKSLLHGWQQDMIRAQEQIEILTRLIR